MNYRFFVENNGMLVCERTSNQFIFRAQNNDAFSKLSELDKYRYNNIRIFKNRVVLSNGDITFEIDNYNRFCEFGFIDLLNSKYMINRSVMKYKRAQHKKRRLKQLKSAIVGVTVSATILSAIGLGLETTSKANVDVENASASSSYEVVSSYDVDSVDNIDFDEDILSSSQVETNVIVDNNILTSNPVETEVVEKNESVVYLDYEHNRNSEKGNYAFDNYFDIVSECATKWGVSSNIIMSMLTQESGGYHDNLMQIQFYSWEGQIIDVYNFVANKYEKIVLTNDPASFKENYNDIITISESDLNNAKTNISVGTILFRESARFMKNHIAASIQCYNFGVGNMYKVLRKVESETGVSVAEQLNDQSNIDFVKYTNMINVGDSNYLANVMQYTNNLEDGFVLKEIDEVGNIVEKQIKILPSNSMGMLS